MKLVPLKHRREKCRDRKERGRESAVVPFVV